MTILVIAEHDNNNLRAATLNTVTAAAQLGQDINVLVAGKDCITVAESASEIEGISKILFADAEHYEHQLAEELAPLVISLTEGVSHILAPASTFGKNLLPRVAALLDVEAISDITSILSGDTFIRPVYAGNALATVRSNTHLKVITVRSTAFDACDTGYGPATVETIPVTEKVGISSFISQELSLSGRPDLATAKVVISGGRGLGSAENFKKLDELAGKLDAAVGASRAAVDAGFISNDYQVGQTGKVVAPELYIAIGISGAIQHLAGMKDSKIIVAVNKDEDAPIFDIADYGLVTDLFNFIPEFSAALDNL